MTLFFDNIYINNNSVVGGPYLIDGPLKDNFDDIYEDFYDGEKTFEDCEIKELKKAINILMEKEEMSENEVGVIFSCDLTNQIIISNFGIKEFKIPYLGIYNACASICEEYIIASSLLTNKKMNNVICTTSAHNLTSERQYRNPIEYGGPKPDYSTFTVSASTACIISNKKKGIRIESGTIGKIIDYGVKDAFDMGSAMAPAAVDTLITHLKDTKRNFDYYDLIITGDLGKYGEKIFRELLREQYNINIDNYEDSAVNIYNKDDERVYAGGSGPSCLPTYFYKKIISIMKDKKINKVLLLATGALLSTTSVNQNKTIPCICHAVSVEAI